MWLHFMIMFSGYAYRLCINDFYGALYWKKKTKFYYTIISDKEQGQ